jgi:hypothetical protein
MAEYEHHHVVGRVHGTATVRLCTDCHKLVTRWQRAAGIGLRRDVDYADIDRTRARLVGYALLGELTCRLYGRIISMALDTGGARDGRWSPRSTYDRNRGD